jgi:surface antigen
MRVENLTVALILSTLAGFANANTLVPPSANGGARNDYTDSGIGNLFKSITGSLNGQDRRVHINTVIYAAAMLDNGEVAEWDNPKNGTAGRVKAVLTKPVQGGFCRQLYTEVEKDGYVREYIEYACKTIDSEYWSFYLHK